MDLIKLYETCDLRWDERLEYINSQWFRFKSKESLHDRIKYLRRKAGIKVNESGGTNQTNEEVKELREQIKKNSDIQHTIKLDLTLDKERKDKDIIKKKYNALIEENSRLQDRLDILLELKDAEYEEIKIETIERTKSESTAILLCSDWHIEESVSSESVNWLNSYDIHISEERAKNLFKNAVKLMKSFELETTINTMILALLWDFISGYIHEELMEENELSPTQAILKARNIIRSGIIYILNNTHYNLVIPCNYWNHWRTGKEKKVSSGFKNNFEWMMYNILAEDFANNPRVKFQIANWYFNYITVYDKVLRFHHWDNIKGWWWIGWITIPINNSIKRFNSGKVADIDLFWHFHQTISWKNFVVNGSLIWTSAYGMSFWHEEPSQTLLLLNSKYGKTITTPVFVKD